MSYDRKTKFSKNHKKPSFCPHAKIIVAKLKTKNPGHFPSPPKRKLKNPIFCIVAMNENRIIGDGKKLLWHLPGDLKRLKKMTMGSPLIMGRKTWDSIGRPLPGRANIVLTNSVTWKAEGAIVVNSFKDAIIKADEWIDNNLKTNKNIIQKKIRE